jgi:two-component system, response regulator YesN
MFYKVFLVEDEIVTREGIRDNVDWRAHGFEFCGEAPDGEMALPLMHSAQPDVLITDIRMPFMDGLQLSRIVRDRMPTTRIVILSGHDEFEYAQRAIQLGVSEYLLKPVSVQDLHNVLQKISAELERERGEQQALQRLREQVEENRAALKERFLLRLVTGTDSSTEAIEKARFLGIDLVSRCYLVIVVSVELAGGAEPFDHRKCQQFHQILAGLVGNNPDVILLRKDMAEFVLVLKGNSPEYLLEERDWLLERIRSATEETELKFTTGAGAPRKRITEICRSFVEAMDNVYAVTSGRKVEFNTGFDKAELLKMDKSAVEDYLRSGTVGSFDAFFANSIRPLGETALRSSVARNYILTDIVLAAAKAVDEFGGNVAQVVPELADIETVLGRIETVEQLQEQARAVLVEALVYRDRQVNNPYAGVVKQAQDYIDNHYMDPDLSLNGVAGHVSLSACHFSSVFSQETGRTFKEHLTEIRIKKARELLRTTTMKSFEICYQVGYNDPHYFSQVFRKQTGLTPMEFRLQVRTA